MYYIILLSVLIDILDVVVIAVGTVAFVILSIMLFMLCVTVWKYRNKQLRDGNDGEHQLNFNLT